MDFPNSLHDLEQYNFPIFTPQRIFEASEFHLLPLQVFQFSAPLWCPIFWEWRASSGSGHWEAVGAPSPWSRHGVAEDDEPESQRGRRGRRRLRSPQWLSVRVVISYSIFITI